MSLPLACGADSYNLMISVWYAAATVCSSSGACWETVPHLLGLHLGEQALKYSRCQSCAGRQAAGSGRHISEHGVCLACMINMRQPGSWRCYGNAFPPACSDP